MIKRLIRYILEIFHEPRPKITVGRGVIVKKEEKS